MSTTLPAINPGRKPAHVTAGQPRAQSSGKTRPPRAPSQGGGGDGSDTPFSFTRNTPKHNQCLQLLVDGYVQSFVDFFYLTHRTKVIEAPDDGTGQRKAPTLQMVAVPNEDLDFLRESLMSAEEARRVGEARQMYHAYLKIARYYEAVKDFQLAVHFHEKCLDVARTSIDTEAEGEANENLALAYEQMGELTNAIKYHEKHLRLSRRSKNTDQEAKSQDHLFNVYLRHANESEAAGNWSDALSDHGKCLEISLQTADTRSQAQVHYRMGKAHEGLGDYASAVKSYEQYLDVSTDLKDDDGACIACNCLAKAHKKLNQTSEAVDYLEKLLELSQNADQKAAQGDACAALGIIYNVKGDYNNACQYFEENFDLSRTIGQQSRIDNARVHLGIAKGNASLQEFMNMVNLPDPLQFLKWRLSRAEAK